MNAYASDEDFGNDDLLYENTIVHYICIGGFKTNNADETEIIFKCISAQWVLVSKASNCISK